MSSKMKIPYAAYVFLKKDKQTWGLNFFFFLEKLEENVKKYTWSPIDNKIGAISQQAGILTGIENIKTLPDCFNTLFFFLSFRK